MKAQNRIRMASLLLTALFASTAAAQDFRTARAARQVLVSIPDRKLVVLEGGKVVRTFPVAVGATVSPVRAENSRSLIASPIRLTTTPVS